MQICFVMQRLFNGTACDIIRICLQTMDELYPMTWKLHNYLKKELEAFGIGVVTTRTNQNTDRALYERGASSKGCSLFISVHSNAVGNGVNENVDYPVDIHELEAMQPPLTKSSHIRKLPWSA